MREEALPEALACAETSAWANASIAAALFAVDPIGLGGISLRAASGPVRDRWLAYVHELLAARPMRRVPAQVSEDRLLGGLDLTATLHAGKPVAERGILAAADGGVLLLAMAERLPASIAVHIASAMDTQEVVMERDGLSVRASALIGVIALDEGIAEDELPPATLLERMAFHVDLTDMALRDTAEPLFNAQHVTAAHTQLNAVVVDDSVIEALCATALALGIDSLRATLLALRAARAAAALAGRNAVTVDDATLAGRLVFGSRATRLPAAEATAGNQPDDISDAQQSDQKNSDSAQADAAQSNVDAENNDSEGSQQGEAALNDVVLAATQAAIPQGLLMQLQAAESTTRARSAGRAGAAQHTALRGRPIGVLKRAPRGVRLNLLATLRAAAPWQKLRRSSDVRANALIKPKILVRPEDFHITRYRQRAETTTIFMLDASGSSALHRLAEAKGAVELLLADCYVRRDQVAVVAFRDRQAEVLLPPTRSLVRAKRSLAALPGGGGTPLAAGIDAGMAVAEGVRRRGITPTLVLLTDGRANITRAGTAGREQAQQEALLAARRVRAAGIGTLLIDTSPRPQALGQTLAMELGARYLPLPYADSTALARAVQVASSPVPHRIQ